MTFASYFNAGFVNIAFFIGGLSENGSWGNLYWPLIYDFFFMTYQLLAFYVTMPKAAKFYKWEDEYYYQQWDSDHEEVEEDVSTMDGTDF